MFFYILLFYALIGIASIDLFQKYMLEHPDAMQKLLALQDPNKSTLSEPEAIIIWIILWPLILPLLYMILNNEKFYKQCKDAHDKKNGWMKDKVFDPKDEEKDE